MTSCPRHGSGCRLTNPGTAETPSSKTGPWRSNTQGLANWGRGVEPVCGIVGMVARGSAVPEVWLERATRSLAHRGPDDHGTVIVRDASPEPVEVGLGNRRLAILDLSPLGHQPMQDPATGNWLVHKQCAQLRRKNNTRLGLKVVKRLDAHQGRARSANGATGRPIERRQTSHEIAERTARPSAPTNRFTKAFGRRRVSMRLTGFPISSLAVICSTPCCAIPMS